MKEKLWVNRITNIVIGLNGGKEDRTRALALLMSMAIRADGWEKISEDTDKKLEQAKNELEQTENELEQTIH